MRTNKLLQTLITWSKWILVVTLATIIIGIITVGALAISAGFGLVVFLFTIVSGGILNILSYYFLAFYAVKELRATSTLKATNIAFLVIFTAFLIEGGIVYFFSGNFPSASGKLVSLIAGWYGAKKADKTTHVSIKTLFNDIKKTFQRRDESNAR